MLSIEFVKTSLAMFGVLSGIIGVFGLMIWYAKNAAKGA